MIGQRRVVLFRVFDRTEKSLRIEHPEKTEHITELQETVRLNVQSVYVDIVRMVKFAVYEEIGEITVTTTPKTKKMPSNLVRLLLLVLIIFWRFMVRKTRQSTNVYKKLEDLNLRGRKSSLAIVTCSVSSRRLFVQSIVPYVADG